MRSARLEIHVTRDGEPVYYVRDWCGNHLCDGRPYKVFGYGAEWAKRITQSSAARLRALINACGPQVEYTNVAGLVIVAEWPPAPKG